VYEKVESYEVEKIEGIGYEVHGKFKDDIHNLHSRILFDINSWTVAEAEVKALVVPFALCHTGLDAINSLIGVSVGMGFSRVVNKQIMGSQGCYHLGELVLNSVKAFLQAASRDNPDWLGEEECQNRWLEWVNNYKNICIYFSQPCISPQDIQKSLGQNMKLNSEYYE